MTELQKGARERRTDFGSKTTETNEKNLGLLKLVEGLLAQGSNQTRKFVLEVKLSRAVEDIRALTQLISHLTKISHTDTERRSSRA